MNEKMTGDRLKNFATSVDVIRQTFDTVDALLARARTGVMSTRAREDLDVARRTLNGLRDILMRELDAAGKDALAALPTHDDKRGA
jgi:hypothetical protein